jgi:sugar phosphate isomerase/epimerase
MKIGVSSYSFSKYLKATKCGYIEICDKAKEMGFDGIEFIDLINEAYGVTGDALEVAREVRAHCESIGLEIVAYTIGSDFFREDVRGEIERVKRCVDVCEALGAKVMRHDTVWNLRPSHLYTYRDAIEEIVPYIREITEYAEQKGIRTCSENHGFIFQHPQRMEELIRAVNRENYGWLCDMGNFLCVDADPAEAVVAAAPHAFHVHAKDFLFKAGTEDKPFGFSITTEGGNYIRGTVLGHGVVPIKQCVGILKRSGYDKWISLEFEGSEDVLPAIENGLKFLRHVVG